MRPIINSEKRIRQVSLSTVDALNTANVHIVLGSQDPTPTDPIEVAIGTVVKAIYIELWLLATSQQPATTIAIVYKIPSGAGVPSFAQMQDLNGYSNKKNIFETHQGLVGDANTNPVPFWRGWIKIPKGKQRIGLDDRISLNIASITEDIQFCGIAIYKAYN